MLHTCLKFPKLSMQQITTPYKIDIVRYHVKYPGGWALLEDVAKNRVRVCIPYWIVKTLNIYVTYSYVMSTTL